MRINTALRIAASCALLSAASCDDVDRDEPIYTGGGLDAAMGARDSSIADSATPSDTGTAADTGTVADTGAGADTGTGADAGGDAAAPLDASADAQADAGGLLASSSGPWTVYPDPYGDAGGANPAQNIQGSATARAVDGGLQITLSVSGLPAARGFGSHLHKLACNNMSAGGHFQHMPAAAADAAVSDPAFANPSNEVWLDFTTDDAGAAMSSASVSWIPPDGGAAAIIVHDRLTSDGGIAGPKLACLPFPL
jgi:Cu-Zn family superoxide dismutase